MSEQLSKCVNLTSFNASTGATSLALEVDTAGYEGIRFFGATSTTATAITMTLSTAASTTASFVALSGGTAASTGGKAMVCVDNHKPRKRWIKGTLSSTAAAPMFVWAELYGPKKLPVTWSSTAVLTSLVSPNT